MEHSLIFVATSDAAFETLAMEAVLGTGHGMRPARNIHDACRVLGSGTSDIALAIVDLDLDSGGVSLMHIMGGCGHEFPILTIAESELEFAADGTLFRIAADHLVKPVTVAALQRKIEEMRPATGAEDGAFDPLERGCSSSGAGCGSPGCRKRQLIAA